MMRIRLKWLLFSVLSICLTLVGISYYQAVTQIFVLNQNQRLEIKRGDSVQKIITKLHQQHIPVNPFWFKWLAYHKNLTDKLKVGEYQLVSGLTLPDILKLLTTGKTQRYIVTFPEGWTFKQMRAKLAQHADIKHTLENVDDQTIMARLHADSHHPEGLFFPDTYFFARQATDFSILKKAYDKMQRVLAEEWRQRETDIPLAEAYQALILASIVEKETALASERPLIAGVFVRRLQLGMLLQTDPTVIYGMGNRYHGNIRSKDLHTYTPYNTYMIKGLPPTPIAMPGREALHAVLHPTHTDKLYFVARGDGSHVFSSTLTAHHTAVNLFQRHRTTP